MKIVIEMGVVMSGFETLLSPSGILVYGRVLQDLEVKLKDYSSYDSGAELTNAPPRVGSNKFLQKQLQADGARFARIYAYSFEGQFYELMRPVLLLVHGNGEPVEGIRPVDEWGRPLAHPPGDADNVGVAAQIGNYSQDMRVWAYDKSDFTICMDVDTGTFEEVILAAGLDSPELGFASGATARGATARGATARGATARGATARGATARGATARGSGE